MSFRRALLLIIIAEIGVALLGVINYGFTIDGLQATTRFSGRLSLAVFSLIFLFQKSEKFNIRTVLSEKYFAVFAIAHGIHLIELLSFLYASGAQPPLYRLAGGFLAYALIFFMPIAQLLLEKGRITARQFATLNLVYVYYVWFIFFMTYLPRVRGTLPNVGGSYTEFVILLGWVSMMMGIKLQGLIAVKRNSAHD